MLDRGQCAVARTRGGRSAKGAAGSTSCAAPPKGREHLGEMGGDSGCQIHQVGVHGMRARQGVDVRAHN